MSGRLFHCVSLPLRNKYTVSVVRDCVTGESASPTRAPSSINQTRKNAHAKHRARSILRAPPARSLARLRLALRFVRSSVRPYLSSRRLYCAPTMQIPWTRRPGRAQRRSAIRAASIAPQAASHSRASVCHLPCARMRAACPPRAFRVPSACPPRNLRSSSAPPALLLLPR